MMGCCCGGAKEMQVRGEDHLFQLCKDSAFPHPKRSKACEALASLPPSVPLSFGYTPKCSWSSLIFIVTQQ